MIASTAGPHVNAWTAMTACPNVKPQRPSSGRAHAPGRRPPGPVPRNDGNNRPKQGGLGGIAVGGQLEAGVAVRGQHGFRQNKPCKDSVAILEAAASKPPRSPRQTPTLERLTLDSSLKMSCGTWCDGAAHIKLEPGLDSGTASLAIFEPEPGSERSPTRE